MGRCRFAAEWDAHGQVLSGLDAPAHALFDRPAMKGGDVGPSKSAVRRTSVSTGHNDPMSQTSRESALRGLLEESLTVGDGCLRTVTMNATLAVTQAWFIRTVDSIRAATLLLDSNLASVASPLVRAAMEHTIGMMWLQEVGDDGLRGLENSHRSWVKNIGKASALVDQMRTEDGGSGWSPEIAALVAQIAAEEPTPKVPGEWQHKERFEVAKQFDLYVAWLSETAVSHATKESATPYMVEADGRIVLLRKPSDDAPNDLVARCAVVAVYALRTMAETLDSVRLGQAADRLAEEIRTFLEPLG
jgi:hypothetical protein